MIHELRNLASNPDLSIEESRQLLQAALREDTTPEQIGAMLGLLHLRPATQELLTGFALELARHRHSISLAPSLRSQLIDVCGTGGDSQNGISTFNVSTTVAFLVNACGVPIAKHGNRAISSRSGSFDLLEALQVPFCQDSNSAQSDLESKGLAFLFAPSFQPALKVISPIRKKVGLRTLFNALGPLLNPAEVQRQVVGVYDVDLLQPMAECLRSLGSRHALIVHGEDGLDEITLGGITHAVELKDGDLRSFTIDPREFGIPLAPHHALRGGEPELNAQITESILSGEVGARADLVCLNAAAALLVSGIAKDLREGLEISRSTQISGRGIDVLHRARGISNHTLKRASS